MIPLPTLEPKGELVIRYEPDTKDLYILAGSFKRHCAARQINYKDTLAELHKMGVFIEPTNKRMSKGMKLVAPPVRALKFNATNFDIINLEKYIPKADDENRESSV